MQDSVSLWAAFGAGVVSFVSPCVLPLVPAYITYISGISLDELKGNSTGIQKVLYNTLAFVLGFSAVFIILGATATFIGSFLNENRYVIMRVGGILIIIFGLHMMGVFRIAFLNFEKRLQVNAQRISLVSSFLIGLAFAFGWSPCLGPILTVILTYASTRETVAQGIILLSFYSAGLGIPFLLTGASVNYFFKFFNRIKKHLGKIEFASGLILVLVGILFVMNKFGIIANWIQKLFPSLVLG